MIVARGGATGSCSPQPSAWPDDDRRDGLTSGRRDQVAGNRGVQSLFFGAILFVITLALNVLGDSFVRRTRQKY
jgi:hypothetical protein